MGKFKEIDLDIQDTMYFSIKLAISTLAIVSTIGVIVLSAENNKLEYKNRQIEQDRTELMTENKQLQEENEVLKMLEVNSSEQK